MAEQLAAHCAMAKDLSSVASTHTEELMSLQQDLPSAPRRYRYRYSSFTVNTVKIISNCSLFSQK